MGTRVNYTIYPKKSYAKYYSQIRESNYKLEFTRRLGDRPKPEELNRKVKPSKLLVARGRFELPSAGFFAKLQSPLCLATTIGGATSTGLPG